MVITDAIDSNLTNINPLDGGTFDGSVVTWPTIPVFGAGATVSVQFEADVKFGLDIAPPTAIFNTRTISSPDLSTDVQTNTTVHFVIGNPSIGLTKQVDQDLFSTPGPATYTYTVTNTGDVTLHNVSVSDDQEGPITLAPGAITGGTAVHNVTQAEIDAGDDIVNIAVATSDEATSGPASETVSVVQNPLVGVTKTAVVSAVTRTVTNTVNEGTGEGASNSATQISTSLVVAQNIVYTKTVKNDGNTTLTNVTLVDTLPSDITITANPDGGDVSTLGEISWDHGSIAVGGSANRPNRV